MAQELFSSTYREARRRLLAAAELSSARVLTQPAASFGPAGEQLATDFIWLGAAGAQRIILHLAGLHGVEGFLGSAVQLDLLSRPPALDANTALLLVHALNPYGMAWLRRVNENNVDLNRNFLPPGGAYSGAAEAYVRLHGLLNPARSPAVWDGFHLRAAVAAARYGFAVLKQAVAEGQYEYPQGLFFGGRSLEPASEQLLNWLDRLLPASSQVAVIDVHSGLGRYGEDALLVDAVHGEFDRLQGILGGRVTPLSSEGVAYRIPGSLLLALPRFLPDRRWSGVGQEFGTLSPLKMIQSLRAENYWHHHGNSDGVTHAVKRQLLRAFCPADSRWRNKVVRRGRELVDAVAGVFEK